VVAPFAQRLSVGLPVGADEVSLVVACGVILCVILWVGVCVCKGEVRRRMEQELVSLSVGVYMCR
jgi:hypothetical protein